MASKHHYREAASMLEAVNQLSTHFNAFKSVPKICEMRAKIGTIRLMLRSSIFKDFERCGTHSRSGLVVSGTAPTKPFLCSLLIWSSLGSLLIGPSLSELVSDLTVPE
jgi:hypothetical protein